MTQQNQDVAEARTHVDVLALESSATQLLAASSDCRHLAGTLTRHAPDPGLPPAPDAVGTVMVAAVEVLETLGAALQETAGRLARTAEGYESTERALLQASTGGS